MKADGRYEAVWLYHGEPVTTVLLDLKQGRLSCNDGSCKWTGTYQTKGEGIVAEVHVRQQQPVREIPNADFDFLLTGRLAAHTILQGRLPGSVEPDFHIRLTRITRQGS